MNYEPSEARQAVHKIFNKPANYERENCNFGRFTTFDAKKIRGLGEQFPYHPGFGPGSLVIRTGETGNMIEIMGKKIEMPKPAAAVAEPAVIKKTTTEPPATAGAPAAPAPAGVSRGGVPAKAAVKKKSTPKPKTAAGKTSKAKPVTFSRDDIALRAYFIAEDRSRKGLPGDSHSDWLEAERQLRVEQKKKSAKKASASKKRA
jgi:hypothetical protein